MRGGEAFILFQMFDYWDEEEQRDRVGTHEHGIKHVSSREALAAHVELIIDGALPTDDR